MRRGWYAFGAVWSSPAAVRCREHMICPLPRANEMSALRGETRRSIEAEEGHYDLRRHRHGAGDEDPGSDSPSDERGADMAAGCGYSGDAPAEPASMARAAAAGGL